MSHAGSPSQEQGASNASSNFFSIVSEYVEHMLPSDNSMKLLLVDEDTLNIISMAVSQTALLKKGVFLVSRVDRNCRRNTMKNMRCIIFIRPQNSSVNAVCDELCAARYESYAIYFSTAAGPDLIDRLARADVNSLVNRVGEVFCDFIALNGEAFIPAVSSSALLPAFLSAVTMQRLAESIAATFVAQRRRPHVRYDRTSAFASRLAMELGNILGKNAALYDYRTRDDVLLILDRCTDVLTPLVTPWTYQAMLHEHIGLCYNRLRLPDAAAEGEEYVFSQQDDTFFAANMFVNWGDLCNNVKAYVDQCKTTLNIDRSTATMEEIRDFMQRLPQTKSLTGSVTKHATVVSHLSSVIKKRKLLDISLLEQDMIATVNANDHWNRLQTLVKSQGDKGISNVNGVGAGDSKSSSGALSSEDVLRLCLIYHLRYEKANQPSRVAGLLVHLGPHYTSYLKKLQQYYGERSTEELFGATGVMASIVKTFVDVGNIYTQHEPVLKRTLLQLLNGRLSIDQYPYLTVPSTVAANSYQLPQQATFKPKEITAFMCGGFTYAEVALVNAINAGTAYTGSVASGIPHGTVRAVISGTTALNSAEFLSLLSNHP